VSLVFVTVTATYSSGLSEIVYSGNPFGSGAFQAPFLSSSTTTPVTGGFDWNIQRTGGWPLVSSVQLTIDAADSDGNHTVETIVWQLPVRGLAADVVTAGVIRPLLSIDPSVAPGVVAPIGSILPRAGIDEVWQKVGPLDTDWRLLGDASAVALTAFTLPDSSYMILARQLGLLKTQRVRLFGSSRLALQT
jgi:hypothetical protein